ncbi:hypothetical protein GCM10009557_54300 [Virgisporangium ochraceum]
MSRTRYGGWGAPLGDVDFAQALAAAGVAAAAGEPTLATFRHRVSDVGPAHYPWRDPAATAGWNPHAVPPAPRWAQAWRDATGWPRPILAVDLDPSDPQEVWIARNLNHCADAYIPIEATRPAEPWRFPIRVGVLGDHDGRTFLEQLLPSIDLSPWRGDLIEPVVVGRERVACDILILPGSARGSMSSIDRTREIRTGAVVVPGDTGAWSSEMLAHLAARTEAWSIGIQPTPVSAEPLIEICRELSHNRSFDEAFRTVFWPDGVVLADRESIGQTGTVRRAPANLDPSHLTLADEFTDVATSGVFESESGDATALLELEQRAAPYLREWAGMRSLQARITDARRPGEALARFKPGTRHHIDVFIGSHRRDWLRPDATFPEQRGALRPRPLTIVLTENGLLQTPQAREVDLPVLGDSGTVTFELTTRPETTSVDARLIVLSGGRILQTARLPTSVGPAEVSVEPVARPEVLISPPTAELDERRSFDAMVFAGTSADGQTRLTTMVGDAAATVRFTGDAVAKATAKIRRRLAEVVMADQQTAGLAEPAAVELLIFLAFHGSLLRMAIERDVGGLTESLRRSEYLQIVSAEAEAFLPLELAYDFEPPEETAELCPHAVEALSVDEPGSACPGPHTGDIVCPFGFWGLSKVIERQAFRPGVPAGDQFQLRGSPARDRNRIPLGPIVFAASDRVDSFATGTLESLLTTLRRESPTVRQVAAWKDWPSAVAECRPAVLMVLPHTVHSDLFDGYGLEIGANARLWSPQINRDLLPSDRPVIIAFAGMPDGVRGRDRIRGVSRSSPRCRGGGRHRYPDRGTGPVRGTGRRLSDRGDLPGVPTRAARTRRGHAAPASTPARRRQSDGSLTGGVRRRRLADHRRRCSVLTLHLLPARHGDALLLQYGTGSDTHSVLIDGGPSSTVTRRAITGALHDVHSLDLLVVTHIDADHITGVLDLFERAGLPARVDDVWFNGWDHLPSDKLGAKQGDRLSAAIRRRGLSWNGAFGGEAVMVPDAGQLPVRELPGGLRLTLLSPTRQALADLRPVWKKEVEKAERETAARTRPPQPDRLGDERLDPESLAITPFDSDDSAANGSSIAFLAEYEGSGVLLTGDAHSGILVAGLRRLAAERGKLPVIGALKVPHHGSRYNVSTELINAIDCGRFLFSTDGTNYGHPDAAAIARIVTHRTGSRLEFNYRTSVIEGWQSRRLKRRFQYEMAFGEVDGHLRVDL